MHELLKDRLDQKYVLFGLMQKIPEIFPCLYTFSNYNYNTNTVFLVRKPGRVWGHGGRVALTA